MSRENSRTNCVGFTMLEVLVALMVLSIGLLGLAALQVTGMRFTHQSYQRTQATLLTYEIVDRMRGNPLGLAGYPIAITAATPSYGSNDCAASPCTTAQLATYDLNKWRNAIRTAIGGERSSIVANGSLYTIRVEWREQDFDQAQELIVQL